MTKRRFLFLAVNGLLLLAAALAFALGVEGLGRLSLAAVVVLVAIWLGAKLFRRFLWRVGRKLAFSYFLIGVLPIPMVLLLVGVTGYILAGALVGHLFRDTLGSLHRELEETATLYLHRFEGDPASAPVEDADLEIAYYRDGQKVRGGSFAPEAWPAWMVDAESEGVGVARQVPFVVVPQDPTAPKLAIAIESGDRGLLALYRGDVERTLRERSGIWVDITRWDAEQQRVQVEVGNRTLVLGGPEGGKADEDRARFFGTDGASAPWRDRPFLFWAELLAAARPLGEDGPPVPLGAFLNATPRTVQLQVVSSTAEVDTAAWGVLLALAFVLFDIYLAAVLMAVFLIYGLSRAVNRLHKATSAVQRGDFSVRIPVKRRDQIGELQRSFNAMADNLEALIAAAAQKESLEKELQIARELQQNLLPSSLTTTEAVEFASYFEPSAAIGGDYFDLLKVEGGRLAVVVADVSGHGLSAGLRMAMLKAALGMLVEQKLPATEIFSRLHRMVRNEQRVAGGRPMVTAVLGIFDPRTGTLDLTNAGHVPTYRLREGKVEEILLPSPPLGGLGDRWGSRSLALHPGDVIVWLSDGLIEARDPIGDPYGYERVTEALVGVSATATEVRDRLLARVAAHSAGRAVDDDRTLVVMRYLPGAPRGA